EQHDGGGGYGMMTGRDLNGDMAERLELPRFAPVNQNSRALGQHVVVEGVDVDDTLAGIGGKRRELCTAGGATGKERHGCKQHPCARSSHRLVFPTIL